IANGDQAEAARIEWDATVHATEAAASAYMSYASAYHGVTGKAEPIAQKTGEAVRETLQYAAEKGVEATGNAADLAKTGARAIGGSIARAADKTGALIGRTNDYQTAFMRGMRVTPTRAEELKAKVQAVLPDLQAVQKANPNATQPVEVADSIERHIQQNEQHMLHEAGATKDENTPVTPDFKERVQDKVDRFFDENR